MTKPAHRLSRTLQRRVLASLFKVKHDDANVGFGFHVGGGYGITAAHCLPHVPEPLADEVFAEIYPVHGAGQATARVVFADPCADLAILQGIDQLTRAKELPIARMRRRRTSAMTGLRGRPRIGNRTAGKPMGVHVYTSDGQWVRGNCSVSWIYPVSLEMMFEEPIPGGTSGGPICNDAGEVVGVVSQIAMRGDQPLGESYGMLLAAALPAGFLKELRQNN